MKGNKQLCGIVLARIHSLNNGLLVPTGFSLGVNLSLIMRKLIQITNIAPEKSISITKTIEYSSKYSSGELGINTSTNGGPWAIL